jgi:predicted ATPase
LGKPDLARQRIEKTLEDARTSGNPYALVVARACESALSVFLRDVELAEAASAEALTLSEDQGYPYFAARARISLGWARSQRGQRTEGLTLMHTGLNELVAMDARLTIPVYLTLLAEVQLGKEELVEALETIDQALLANPQELAGRPEAIRLKGDVRVKLRQNDLAEADYRDAVALARSIRAKSWELRAATSLLRLLKMTHRSSSASEILRPIYTSFTEGFDTSDLIEAKKLLEECEAAA